MKSRKQKLNEYEEKYRDVPRDYKKRLNWLCDQLNITTDNQYDKILKKRQRMISSLYYSTYLVVLYEDPEGSPRPRARLINKHNVVEYAINSPRIHIYSISGKQDRDYMRKLMSSDEVYALKSIIYTPCDVEYRTYFKTPSYFSKNDKILAEIGLIRPITKPDWDNIGKKYSDMYNSNVWIDDANVIRGTVDKFYSALPRVEIELNFLNALYTSSQRKAIEPRVEKAVNDLQNIELFFFNNEGEIKS